MHRLIRVAVIAVVSIRIASTIWAAVWNTHGDYYASLPGTYVKTVNPVLWDSPDMRGAMGYHLDTYYHGPTQYLTLYPVAFLDSYEQIAWVLLPLYAVALALAWLCLFRALSMLAPGERIALPLFASTFLFFPLLQSFIQREFEVVTFLVMSFALWQLVRNRRASRRSVFRLRRLVQVHPAVVHRLFCLARLDQSRRRVHRHLDRDPSTDSCRVRVAGVLQQQRPETRRASLPRVRLRVSTKCRRRAARCRLLQRLV